MSHEVLVRAAGVAATFVLFRTASRLTLGIPSPGTALAVLATAGAAACASGSSVPVCRAQGVLNAPGNFIGRQLVDKGEQVAGLIATRGAA